MCVRVMRECTHVLPETHISYFSDVGPGDEGVNTCTASYSSYFSAVSPGNEGVYTCTASNPYRESAP